MTAFTREARARNICIAVNEKVPHSATMETFDQIYQNLLLKANARGVVLFTRAEDARGVLAAAKRANRSEDFVWVASDGWGKQEKLVEGLEEVAEGAITIELESRFIPEFDAYMRNLTVENNRRNPWFKEYWEDVFQCVVRDDDGAGRAAATATRRSGNGSSLPTCSKNLRLDESVGYLQESKVQFVLDAVYAMAHALHKVWEHLCEPRNELYCNAMRDVDGGVLYKKYLLNVTFEDMAGSIVRFDPKGDGLAPYRIYNYQRQQPNTSRYEYRAVGRWLDELQLNVDEVRWAHNSRRVPVSICSAQCGVGEIKIVQAGDTCCWICNRCEPWQYVLGRVHVRRLRRRPLAVRAQAQLLQPDAAVHALRLHLRRGAGGDRVPGHRAHARHHGRVRRQQRDAHREGFGSRAQLFAPVGHPHLLPHDVRTAAQAGACVVRVSALRRRPRLLDHLQRAAHQDESHLAHLRERPPVSAEAVLHQSKVAGGDLAHADLGASGCERRVVRGRAAQCAPRAPGRQARPGDPQVPHQGLQFPRVPGLQHDAHLRVHRIRHQDAQDTRELQRVQVHRLHHVHHLHHLARVRAHLLRHRKLVPGEERPVHR
ncbi:hypothetical protein HPB51_016052 [Rhipicephalus microplus]|uniref:Receptor ligand binding region domain-containing protein n=1 Tax=Rhipicephalus microplus TaxID=6941 RepID=A0A9J6DIA4_RHIMP|nr:hypothetical protein HPB51_016052 [Rhipicephalus microplus]